MCFWAHARGPGSEMPTGTSKRPKDNNADLIHAASKSKCADEDDDPELQEAMEVATAIAASKGASSFVRGVAAGEAKDALLAARAAAASGVLTWPLRSSPRQQHPP